MAQTKDALNQIKELYANLNREQRIITAIVIAVSIIGFGLLFYITNRPTYKVLYTDLSDQAAGDVVNWLKKHDIPYKLEQGGSTIEVPSDKVYSVRLELASAGLPKNGTVGFEIFDHQGLGTTDFVEHVNYQRALQGELERTIEEYPEVEEARVHIAMPKQSLFVTQSPQPKASVVLKLKPGDHLDTNQLKGIVYLVASSVPQLSTKNVTVVDTTGDILYQQGLVSNNSLSKLTQAQIEYQRQIENYYKQKIQSMLDEALGPGEAIARVSADIDFDKVDISEDRYDPDNVAIRSQQKILETLKNPATGGIPGVKGGLANKLQGNINQASNSTIKEKQETTTNYEITEIKKQINGAVGKIKRLSVAVLVDGTYKLKDGKKVYVPRSPQEMAALKKIVKAAIGYSEDRGDELSVVNVPFNITTKTTSKMARAIAVGSKLIRPITNLVLALLFIFLVLRPLLKRYVFKPEEPEALPTEGAGEGIEAIEGGLGEEEALPHAPAFEPLPNVHEELRNVANDYPERAAALIKIWLREKIDDGTESSKS